MAFITCCALAPPVQPSVPEDVEPKEPNYLGAPNAGRFIIPEGIRPLLKEFRIEVRCLLLGWPPDWAAHRGWQNWTVQRAGFGAGSCLELKWAFEA